MIEKFDEDGKFKHWQCVCGHVFGREKPMSKLTDEQKEIYLSSGGVICPFCESTDIFGGAVELDSGIAWQEISCESCGKKWRDCFKLTGIEEVEE
jgi:transposase-like protein